MIFQEPMSALNPSLKCGFQVSEILRHHLKMNASEAKNETLSLFKKVHLPRPNDIFNSYPHQISGGQMQRVMIAMALANKPDLLIADEPTTALDVTVQAQILQLLADIQKEMGLAILLITHDLGVVAEVADRVLHSDPRAVLVWNDAIEAMVRAHYGDESAAIARFAAASAARMSGLLSLPAALCANMCSASASSAMKAWVRAPASSNFWQKSSRPLVCSLG